MFLSIPSGLEPRHVGAEPAPSGQDFTYTMRAQGRLVTEEDFANIVIRENPDGSAIRMKDVARIELGAIHDLRRFCPSDELAPVMHSARKQNLESVKKGECRIHEPEYW
ncbi:MAG: acrB [Candidatus Acidoferrum typicum]|jgi:hypothetical protein|nr:acrB [Candidatus Acidoferrum typicum]